jgi:hypothetical protein
VASAGSFLGGAGQIPPSSAAVAGIPPAMLALYQEAATTCAGLPWTVLAAIGIIESDNGQSRPAGRVQRCERGRRRGSHAFRAGDLLNRAYDD